MHPGLTFLCISSLVPSRQTHISPSVVTCRYTNDDSVANVGRVGISCTLLLALPLILSPCRDTLLRLLREWGPWADVALAASGRPGHAQPNARVGNASALARHKAGLDASASGCDDVGIGGGLATGVGAGLLAFPAPTAFASLEHGFRAPSSPARSAAAQSSAAASRCASEQLSDSGAFSEGEWVGGFSETGTSGGHGSGGGHGGHDGRSRARSVSGGFGGFAREAALARAEAELTRHSAGDLEPSSGDGQPRGAAAAAQKRRAFVACTLAVYASQFLLAVAIPSVSIIWGILGSTGALAIAFTIPAASYLQVTSAPAVAARKRARRGLATAMVYGSLALALLCTTSTVYNLVAAPTSKS